MRFSTKLLFTLPTVALALAVTPAHEAAACGGVFVDPTETTQVASHRMALSISQTQSTLWDEIQYQGSPASFAWVLPIKGAVTVGVSSDLLFAELDQLTAVTVQAPLLPCNPCGVSSGEATSASSGGGVDAGGGVTIVSQAVVGPYETVQLASTDPTALTTWLTTNGYAIPSDIAPVVAAYVGEGFNFLALKLVPGMSVTAMQPVRVTTPGASPVLPLRMVAAGAGTTVPITLFVVGEGRYEPTNFPSFTIPASALVWDFSVEKSNYSTLRTAGFAATSNKGWLVESAQPESEQQITDAIDLTVQQAPLMSGYADSTGNGAPAAAQADLDTLFGGINTTSLWITRLLGELPRTALTTDLTLGASTDQTTLPSAITPAKYINAPPCPCGGTGTTSSGTGGAGGAGGAGGTGGAGGSGGSGGSSVGGGSSCAVGGTTGTPFALGGLLAALGLAAVRRRRAR